ncbi:MogA/MoaB family molybdenum cofactor biosynthesis protein [Veillonella montpellierensis]|uniref:MogA/MoaB family molybdenum cofactor biosynthesis protein n=1 Tax=Veillonella montpellierensis TaxID=187328 RepID=UPI0023F7B1F3|nr:MogA/MoaB family molybdenum cofactor biosynthesis protein [Veillonella montpellierensis]
MSHMEMDRRPLEVAILTVSDTRTWETDKGGQTVAQFVKEAHHHVAAQEIVPDDYDQIQSQIREWLREIQPDCIITTGGTGIAKRDVTIEAVTDLLDKEIPGFGEIFRYISYVDDIGTRAMASRAVAGVSEKTVIFSLPGSVGAVSLGMERLIIPEMAHAVYEVNK